MKTLVLTMIAVLSSISVFAQELTRDELRQMSRKERKEYEAKQRAVRQEQLGNLLDTRQWVLEAYQAQDRYGETYIIESNLNFVSVIDETGTVQLGSSGEIGLNGLGGITVDGKITKYSVSEKKSGYFIQLHISGASAGHVSMAINVTSDGMARATLTDISGNRIIYTGNIIPLAQSSSYKGQVVF